MWEAQSKCGTANFKEPPKSRLQSWTQNLKNFTNCSPSFTLFCFFKSTLSTAVEQIRFTGNLCRLIAFSLDYHEDALKSYGFITVWISNGKRLIGWFGLVGNKTLSYGTLGMDLRSDQPRRSQVEPGLPRHFPQKMAFLPFTRALQC